MEVLVRFEMAPLCCLKAGKQVLQSSPQSARNPPQSSIKGAVAVDGINIPDALLVVLAYTLTFVSLVYP